MALVFLENKQNISKVFLQIGEKIWFLFPNISPPSCRCAFATDVCLVSFMLFGTKFVKHFVTSCQDHKTRTSLMICANLDVSPGDWQDGAGAPGSGADGAQRVAGVAWMHGNHRMAGQEGGEVGLPDEEQIDCDIFLNSRVLDTVPFRITDYQCSDLHSNRPHARSSPTMRDAEGLVQVEMRHVRAIISRATQTHLERRTRKEN